ncbi:MAG: hypothetical protein UX94_C0004G0028 [Parcubacteria group bacterium GW2011_GWA2_47_21]|nr:MAG: hypothetical protein UX94_C0004G0028 [Parcubacteria group bacterium GW2011_GWA2_47_21]
MRDNLRAFLTAVISGILFIGMSVFAATTISTSIQTDGTLSVTGAAVNYGDLTTGGDLYVNGADFSLGTGSATTTLTVSSARLGVASTTPWGLFSIESDNSSVGINPIFVVGDQGTSTPLFIISGNDGRVGVGTSSPGVRLGVAGDINANIVYGDTLVATSTTATSTLKGGLTVDTSTLVVDFSSNSVGVSSSSPFVALGVTGTTTSSWGAILGLNGAPINQLRFGTCTYNPAVSLAASSTLSTNCTGATGVNTSDRVFVTPVSLEIGLIMTSASSTADNVIQVSVMNTGNREPSAGYGTAVTPASATWFWMAIR